MSAPQLAWDRFALDKLARSITPINRLPLRFALVKFALPTCTPKILVLDRLALKKLTFDSTDKSRFSPDKSLLLKLDRRKSEPHKSAILKSRPDKSRSVKSFLRKSAGCALSALARRFSTSSRSRSAADADTQK